MFSFSFDFGTIWKIIKNIVWKIIEKPFKLINLIPTPIRTTILIILFIIAITLIVLAWKKREDWRNRIAY